MQIGLVYVIHKLKVKIKIQRDIKVTAGDCAVVVLALSIILYRYTSVS